MELSALRVALKYDEKSSCISRILYGNVGTALVTIHPHHLPSIHSNTYSMGFHCADTLEKHDSVGGGLDAYIYRVAPTIAVKTVRHDRTPDQEAAEHPFLKEIAFYKRLNERRDRCQNIIQSFLILPDHLFLSYCTHKSLAPRFYERQERDKSDGYHGRLLRVKEYEDPALIALWIEQVTSALEYVEKMGFCHNDLHASNCLLDENLDVKLADFGRATTIGQALEGVLPPRAQLILEGPLKGTYGLCSARTEQFAVGTLLYFMVYGHEPYDDLDLSAAEWDRRFGNMEFRELNRHEVFDGLIAACWYNVYPTMALVAYDFKHKTRNFALDKEYNATGDSTNKTTACEHLIRRGLLGRQLALRFQPAWRRYIRAIIEKSMSIWRYLLQRIFSVWSR